MMIAIVTGATSGLGREMVFQLADRFAGLEEIWVIGRRREKLDELEGQVPVRLRKFAIDLTSDTGLHVLAHTLKVVKPEVKLLVNASGCGKTGRVGEISVADTRNMVRLNCEALTAVTELVLPYISNNSRIIQLASSAAFMPQPGFATYAATKAYVLSYSRALSEELSAREIHVTAVCPGPVDTEFFDYALNGKKLAGYKKLVMAKPKAVVKRAIEDSMAGKPYSIYGIPMKLFHKACKFLPHRLMMKFVRW